MKLRATIEITLTDNDLYDSKTVVEDVKIDLIELFMNFADTCVNVVKVEKISEKNKPRKVAK